MEKILLNVNDLKQYFYCPRIIYYNWVIPVTPPPTYFMERGQNLEDEFERLEPRRTLSKYGFDSAERIFHVTLTDWNLGLTGKTDLLLKSKDKLAIVDMKASSAKTHLNRRIQLASYALLAENQYNLPCPLCFLVLMDSKEIEPVPIDSGLREKVISTLLSIRSLLEEPQLPDPTPIRAKCLNCEFRNFCGDIF